MSVYFVAISNISHILLNKLSFVPYSFVIIHLPFEILLFFSSTQIIFLLSILIVIYSFF